MRSYFPSRRAAFFIFAALVTLASCGHKIPLTLAPYEVPGPPENLAAVQREDIVTLSWSYRRSEKVKAFLIERSFEAVTGKAGPGKTKRVFEKIGLVTGDSFSGPVAFGNLYTYRVRAISPTGVLGKPAFITFPALIPPPSPRGLTFKIGDSLVALKWEAEGPWNGRQVFYNVYARAAAVSSAAPAAPGKPGFSLLNPAPLKANIFSVTAYPDRDMIYQVRALLGGPLGYEGKSVSLAVRRNDFVPARPERPDAVRIPGGIRLIWQPNPETWISGYRVFKVINGKLKEIGFSSVPTFLDEGASSGTYRISAVGSVSQSPLSEPVSFP